jgi:hypothetical protein
MYLLLTKKIPFVVRDLQSGLEDKLQGALDLYYTKLIDIIAISSALSSKSIGTN